ncbi:MAG: ThuA domain-containing protein [Chthoniobacterales bacterium]
MSSKIRVTVFGENLHEQNEKHAIRKVYPTGLHTCLVEGLNEASDISAKAVTLQDVEHGLTQDVLDATDVLVWWGHIGHDKVQDEVVTRVQRRVWEGMGLVALHSAHYSKIFKALLGTACSLRYREAAEKERLWVCNPGHPIAEGVSPYFEIPEEEMYGEPFSIPTPDEQVFISWFEGGEVFRSGCTWKRGQGKIFYFRPGHEAYPTYHNETVRKVLKNSVRWAKPDGSKWVDECIEIPEDKAPEKIRKK